jgi:hypothetical protein
MEKSFNEKHFSQWKKRSFEQERTEIVVIVIVRVEFLEHYKAILKLENGEI